MLFLLGVFVGGFFGVTLMCIFMVSGRESELERRREDGK